MINQLREYQVEIANRGVKILRSKMMLYLSMAVRCGKTLTALEICKLYGAKRILFITKLKAFSSIEDDYNKFNYEAFFNITIINKESIHKIETNDFDVIVCDEAHGLFGTYPKPNNFTKNYKKRFSKIPAILLSGTPTPESFSQIYHQFFISKFSPFGEASFYKWAHNFVNVKKVNRGYSVVNDYSDARIDLIREKISPYIISFTQKEAGFTSEVNENILYCDMSEMTYKLIKQLKRDLFIQGKDELVLADTGIKMMSKVYQLSNGHVIFESGNSKIMDLSKGLFIKESFKGQKIAILYKFKNDLEILKQVYGDRLTESIEEFNTTDKNLAMQFIRGREGVNLSSADKLVFYTLDFSATTYFQARARLQTKDRLNTDVYFIFTRGGMEQHILKALNEKKNFTLSHFKKIP